jgi:hypothetical protein
MERSGPSAWFQLRNDHPTIRQVRLDIINGTIAV